MSHRDVAVHDGAARAAQIIAKVASRKRNEPGCRYVMKILLTGAAGFIGMHAAKSLLARGDTVIGVDNLNDYYDVSLKQARLAELAPHKNFQFIKVDLKDRGAIEKLFADHKPQRVLHLAAQAGVRYSLTHPHQYIDANLVGFLNVLEGCRQHGVAHLLFASSSSVYGANTKMPYSTHDNVDHPLSLYAATKKANELMAHSYAHLYGLPVTGLRFFTVYGPWGRPDMAPFLFTRKIIAGEPIDVFNEGNHKRDFTYIDDVVEGTVRTLDQVPAANPAWSSSNPDPATSSAPYRLYNIGNHTPVSLLEFIATIERATGKPARKRLLPMQPGDVLETYADVSELKAATGFEPKTPLDEGIKRFVAWYREFYRV
jgi:UDP-glucuronate 4-epimerase